MQKLRSFLSSLAFLALASLVILALALCFAELLIGGAE